MFSAQNSTTPIFLSSLDPPDIERKDLEPPFAPHQDRPLWKVGLIPFRLVMYSDWLEQTAKSVFVRTPGFRTLPRILIPPSGSLLSVTQPPVMHYGWSIDRIHLLNYAAKHGLTVYDFFDARVSYHTADSDELHHETQFYVFTDEFKTMSAALEYIVTTIGGKSPPRGVQLGEILQGSHPFVVSLYTNYTLQDATTESFNMALCKELGLTGAPRWYICAYKWHWHRDVPPLVMERACTVVNFQV